MVPYAVSLLAVNTYEILYAIAFGQPCVFKRHLQIHPAALWSCSNVSYCSPSIPQQDVRHRCGQSQGCSHGYAHRSDGCIAYWAGDTGDTGVGRRCCARCWLADLATASFRCSTWSTRAVAEDPEPAHSSTNGDLWCVELAPANSDADTIDPIDALSVNAGIWRSQFDLKHYPCETHCNVSCFNEVIGVHGLVQWSEVLNCLLSLLLIDVFFKYSVMCDDVNIYIIIYMYMLVYIYITIINITCIYDYICKCICCYPQCNRVIEFTVVDIIHSIFLFWQCTPAGTLTL